ncbi:hypothetical protein FRB94_004875 [Tulasnella sp. JGI-2019a]|nr:hypothetical protein FRB93_005810 [Tulasnella sp. JGI-2019a]KAG9001222.1 hypothetical protein FRB94_004875 [Tulasnella sp. JGI-2019a]
MCYRQTTTVLATSDVVDFLYTCDNHLTDPGFATPLASETPKPQISAEEIARVKKEYEEKQQAKKEKVKEKEKEKEKTDEDWKDEKALKPKVSTPSPSTPATPPAVPLPRFVLHRQIYQMRCDEHRKRRQAKQVREVAPKLPIAPRDKLQ